VDVYECVCCVFVRQHDYDAGVRALIAALTHCTQPLSPTDTRRRRAHLYSRGGRLCVQLGDVRAAATWFARFNQVCDHNDVDMRAIAFMHKYGCN
jgi:hypothetical protein